MTKSPRIALMTVALIALAMMAPRARAAPSPRSPQASTPAAKDVPTPRGILPVNVRLHGPECDHDVSPARASLHTSTNDKLRWHVKNDCRNEQKVLFCVYDGQTKLLKNPFAPCMPSPGITYDIGTPFTVAARGQAKFDCLARDQGRFTKQVRVGSEVPAAGCPSVLQTTSPHHGGGKGVHALDIEINP
jgi:hypothetical protein